MKSLYVLLIILVIVLFGLYVNISGFTPVTAPIPENFENPQEDFILNNKLFVLFQEPENKYPLVVVQDNYGTDLNIINLKSQTQNNIVLMVINPLDGKVLESRYSNTLLPNLNDIPENNIVLILTLKPLETTITNIDLSFIGGPNNYTAQANEHMIFAGYKTLYEGVYYYNVDNNYSSIPNGYIDLKQDESKLQIVEEEAINEDNIKEEEDIIVGNISNEVDVEMKMKKVRFQLDKKVLISKEQLNNIFSETLKHTNL
jgi:hypothetical protein